jgi:class 3 adenylate cyclase
MLSLGFAGVLLGFGFLEATLAAGRTAPDAGLTTFLWVAVISGNVALLVILFTYLLGRLRAERARAEGLLLNVLPATVASELKRHGTTQALRFDEVSVLFADIVGFTPMSVEMAPEEMVAELNRVFSFFDSLVDRYACEKIRTVGDNYMVACGVPTPRREHADAAARIALAMIEHSEGGRFRFRIGINSGPVVAGVIGRRKFQYDVWGDTVNTASRMESHGVPGKIQITETTRHLLGDRYVCVPRGPVEIKGKGVLETWFLEGVQEP